MAEAEGVLNLESEELGPGVPAATCWLGDLGQVPSPLWASALSTSKILQIGEIISKLPSSFDILCFLLFNIPDILCFFLFQENVKHFQRASFCVCQTPFVTLQLVLSTFVSRGFSAMYVFSHFSSYISLFALVDCCRNRALFF